MVKSMKRVLSIILIAATLLGCFVCFNGCADDGEKDTTEVLQSETEKETEEPELQIIRPEWLGYDASFDSPRVKSLEEYEEKLTKVKDIDEKYMVAEAGSGYVSAASPYVTLTGLQYKDGVYCRTDSDKLSEYSKDRQEQAGYAAGASVSFITDSSSVAVKLKFKEPSGHMNHTCSTSAFSTIYYVGSGTSYTYCGRFCMEDEPKKAYTISSSLSFGTKGLKVVTIQLPLCTGVETIAIGLRKTSMICAYDGRAINSPICFYGSSNIFGYGTEKPSESFVNYLGRTLDANVMNLGFPGTAFGEKSDIDFIKSLDMSALLLNYACDIELDKVTDNYLNFYKAIRAEKPDLPIIMMTDPVFGTYERFQDKAALRDAVFEAYKAAADDAKLYFIDGDWLLPASHRELYTEDNTYLNGVGHIETARTLYSAFKYILEGSNKLTDAPKSVFDEAKASSTDMSKLEYVKVSDITGSAVVKKEENTVYLDGFSKYFEFTGAEYPKENGGILYRLHHSDYSKLSNLNKEYANYNAGERVRFTTDSKKVSFELHYHSSPNIVFFHFPDTGSAGVDVYVGSGTERIFLGNIAPAKRATNKTTTKATFDLPDGYNEVYIDLPIYASLQDISIGLDADSSVAISEPYPYKPVCFYGSSITEGACVTKPSSTYFNILSRMLGVNCINLGFSGSALGESYAYEYIKEQDISAFVLDYDHNAPSAQHLKDTHYIFYTQVRKAHPDIPIIILTMPYFGNGTALHAQDRIDVIKSTYDRAVKKGDKNVYYICGDTFFPDFNRDMYTVDYCHPNDLGHLKMAEAVYPILKAALEQTYGTAK